MAHMVFDNADGWYSILLTINYDERYLVILDSGVPILTDTNPAGILSGYTNAGIVSPTVVGAYTPR